MVMAEEIMCEYWLAAKLWVWVVMELVVASAPEVSDEKALEAYTLAFSVSNESLR